MKNPIPPLIDLSNPSNQPTVYTYDPTKVRVLEKADSHSSDQGENHLLELSDQLCLCMQHVNDFFHKEEITVNDVSTLKSLGRKGRRGE